MVIPQTKEAYNVLFEDTLEKIHTGRAKEADRDMLLLLSVELSDIADDDDIEMTDQAKTDQQVIDDELARRRYE